MRVKTRLAEASSDGDRPTDASILQLRNVEGQTLSEPSRTRATGPLREEATADSMSLPQYGPMVALIHLEIRARCGFQMAARSAFSTERSLDRGLGAGDGRQADVTVLVHLAGAGEAPRWGRG